MSLREHSMVKKKVKQVLRVTRASLMTMGAPWCWSKGRTRKRRRKEG